MPLSSNTIIHFTRTKESLLGILSEDFRVHYCTETYDLKNFDVKAKVPMVSFCDIPLSEVKQHIGKYGDYGIGLTKSWAKKSGLNPVIYIESQSHISDSLGMAIDAFLLKSKSSKLSDSRKALGDLVRYIKNYQGMLRRSIGDIPEYRFSDEREWRYVPRFDAECEMIVSLDKYNKEKAEIDASVSSLRLRFQPNDIKYIIIKSDDEISEFVDHLRKAKGKHYTYHDVERLTTRLLTAEQILGDM